MRRQLLFLPGPVTVAPDVLDALARPLVNHRGPEFAGLLERVGAALRPVFGTSGDVIPVGSSGTGAMETSVVNLFSPGDRVLSCPVGVFGRRFGEIARSYGCIVEELETPTGAALDPQALRARLESDERHEIAGVLLTHNETSTGVQNDMAALAPIVRAHGAISLVDSVSGLGASEFRMDEWGYDAVVTASQKAFAAPPGVAMAAMSERAWERMEASRSPRYYFDLRRAREASRAGETPWTPPISILYALDVALARYHERGVEAACERHARYAAIVSQELERLGFTLVALPQARSVTVIAAYPPPGVDAAALLRRLRVERGIVLAGGQAELGGKIVRFGTMGDLTEEDIRDALAAIGEIARATSGVA